MVKSVKFLDLHKQYLSIKDEIDNAISSTIESTSFVGSKTNQKFECEFAEYQQAKHCIGVGNGTDAIEISIEALDLPSNSEIIVPANSFIATSEAVTRSGHNVIFADVEENSYNICVADIEKQLTSKTAAIIVVHLYGNPCNMNKIVSLAKKHNLRVIEDSSQAHGAEYHGQRVGALADIGTFSFYPGKNLGAFGDAGAILTNDDNLSKRCRLISNHGRLDKYNHVMEGRNSRLDGIQAAVLSKKLKYLESWIQKRNFIAKKYLAELSDIPGLILPKVDPKTRHAFHLFVIRTKRRDELQQYLSRNGIETGIHYPVALPKQEAYRDYKDIESCPTANSLDSEILSLPIGDQLETFEVKQVINEIRNFFKA